MKKSISIRALAMLAAFILLISLIGCTGQNAETSETSVIETVSQAPQTENSEAPSPESEAQTEQASQYPLFADNDQTLSIWYEWSPILMNSSVYNSVDQFPFFIELSERTGVNFEFTSPGMDIASEQFNLMIASESYTDLICNIMYYSGSYDTAIDDGIFMDITDIVAENCPNYQALLQRDDVRRDALTENGRVACFSTIADGQYPPNAGLVIRKDLLEKVGMESPKTYDQLHDVLSAFKEQLGMEAPLFMENLVQIGLSAGYEFQDGFCNIDGEAVYSVLAPGMKDYLATMKQWYSEGLLKNDYYIYLENNSELTNLRTELVNTNETGVWNQWCEDLLNYAPTDTGYSFGPITNPVVNEGDKIHLTSGLSTTVSSGTGCAISGICDSDKAILGAKVLDYLYSEEGALLACWGVEGETFNYDENGKPAYTDLILNNPDGLGVNAAMAVYCVFNGPCLSSQARFNLRADGDMAEYYDVWSAHDNAYTMPSVTLTAAEQEEYSAISSDVETLTDENLVKFIIGDRSMDEYDDFVQELKDINIDRMVELKQNALDRYLAR